MKNPLNKRIPRELKGDLGKYIVIFLFMLMLISLVSAFLVADLSISTAYNESFEKYNVEDGHISFSKRPDKALIDEFEKRCNLTLHELDYFEETMNQTNKKIRVYKDREDVNKVCVMSGALPSATTEIAIDRMFAENNNIKVGDKLTLNKKELTVSGLVALPDYSCLYENNTDMMFDAINFSVAVMTEEGYTAFDSKHQTINYAWKYPETIDRKDKIAAKKRADQVIEDFKEPLEKYITELMMAGKIDEIISVDSFVPRFDNLAINFTGDDMGSDKIMFLMFDYIITAILAFVFAVTTLNTITKEANVIGTLRASGYSRGQIITHYMVLPILVTLIAALLGNILGYTIIKDYMVKFYYGSYSLTTYTTLWSSEAFIDTTVIPVILMFVINLLVLMSKLKLSPLRFLRRDISKRGKKKAFRLNTKIPILHRFRIRIIFQNIPNYITLFIGVFIGAVVIIFGTMFSPLLADYADLIIDSRIADYQYVLEAEAETSIEDAEKYMLTNLETTNKSYKIDEVSVFGITPNSKYIKDTIPDGKVLICNGLAKKFELETGDTLTLKDSFSDDAYRFEIGGIYDYDSSMAVFMNSDDYADKFNVARDSFTGYFTNTELTDIPDDVIAATITTDDLTKVSNQLELSMGRFMNLFNIFGVIMFLLLMYIMSKQIIERNSQSISMTKILGFTNGEIGKLYIISTSVIVVLSLLTSIPLTNAVLKLMFEKILYKEVPGYIPYIISNSCFIKMLVLGILSYAFVAVLQMFKINHISKSDALKNVE